MQNWKKVLIDHSKQDYILKTYGTDYVNNSPLFLIIKSLKHNKKVLSFGCGGGREVKTLLNLGHTVTAVDISKDMISQSKKIAPDARYFLKEVSEFKLNENFDYILGLDNLLCYLPKDAVIRTIKNSLAMLKENGKAIFSMIYMFSNYRTIAKSLIGFIRLKRFGDVICRHIDPNKPPCIMHYFTFKELQKILKSLNAKYTIERKDGLLVIEITKT